MLFLLCDLTALKDHTIACCVCVFVMTLTSQLGHIPLHLLLRLRAALHGVQAFLQFLQSLLGLLQTLLQLSPTLNLCLGERRKRRKQLIKNMQELLTSRGWQFH